MKHVRSADVIELDLVGGTVVLLVCSTMKATDPGLTLLCGAVFLLLVASRRKTKTIKAQIIEIVDEQGQTCACIGNAASGLSFAITKELGMTPAAVSLSLVSRSTFVQFTIGANPGSTGQAYDKTPFLSIVDSERRKMMEWGLVYPAAGEPRIEQVYRD
jgi:hypothetical protein